MCNIPIYLILDEFDRDCDYYINNNNNVIFYSRLQITEYF